MPTGRTGEVVSNGPPPSGAPRPRPTGPVPARRDAEPAPWSLTVGDLASRLGTDPRRGLTSAEAARRLESAGPNRLPEKPRIRAPGILLRQFTSLLVGILAGAAVLAGFLGDWLDAVVIAAIVLLNAGLGFSQEYRAERSLESLGRLWSPRSRVKRDGRWTTLPSEGLVSGDLILLEAGDRVPADGRVAQEALLVVQEAALTGESIPVEKDATALCGADLAPGDRSNMVFMGTTVASGKAHVLVTATGSGTELGAIALLLRAPAPDTSPLQLQLRRLGHGLLLLVLGVAVVIFLLGLWRGMPAMELLLTSLSLAVAAIPEGLPAVVTVTLALGVHRMARRNALVRRLPAVETLGCASVICTDKTGTLTRNEMTVRAVWVDGRTVDVTGAGYEPVGGFLHGERPLEPRESRELILALEIGVLCNNASLQAARPGAWEVDGDPTEGALLAAAGKAGLFKDSLEVACPLLGEIPFDSERKRMSVLRRTGGGPRLFVKGAPDVLLTRSASIFAEGRVQPLTAGWRAAVERAIADLAGRTFRVLGVAYREVEHGSAAHASLEEALTFVGLVAMSDSPRPEARRAVEACRDAGILPVMVTGDHRATAVAVAREVGMLGEGRRAVDGTGLDGMDEATLARELGSISVFARVSAAHKRRIVRAWKTAGATVAMTGDGVNDAPAVRDADIGVAMGRTGTDVTREAADMVVTDDNFASIVAAVGEGRAIYDNILRFVTFLLSTNLAEVLTVVAVFLLGLREPGGGAVVALTAVQLLWLNLLTDGLPAIALGLDPPAPGVMRRPPRRPGEPILTGRLLARVTVIGALVAGGALAAALPLLERGAAAFQTATMTTLVCLEMVQIHAVRSAHGLRFLSNRWLLAALAGTVVLQVGVVYVPFFQRIFGTVSLPAAQWGVIAAVTLVVAAASRFLTGATRVRTPGGGP